MTVRPRELVLLSHDVEGLAAWYVDAVGLEVKARFDDLPCLNLESSGGLRIGIGRIASGSAEAFEGDARVIPQLETDDVKSFLDRIRDAGGSAEGPQRDRARGFEFGSFRDPDGNAWWVVDSECP